MVEFTFGPTTLNVFDSEGVVFAKDFKNVSI
jgi:hypothetical protein